ncbi:hypothetical protein ACROYT_G003675 [Oculina patagonica]
MEWEQFTDEVNKVKKVTTKIQEETKKIAAICTEYNKLLRDELATPEEYKDLNQLIECLAEIQKNLENVKGKEASKNINIVFLGTTSSGKSSLINALLRERRLPVGFMQTTMCSIKVCTTEQKEWSVTVTDENDKTVVLSETNDETAIKDLLSKMSGRTHSKEREELKINTRSIVQVNWPKELCEVLPLNVVLFDTPGFGEDEESMNVVTQSCREADIIVAVMDAMSPSKATLAKLVKDVNCQFTFGVFTKWDECKRKAVEENEAAVDVEQAREDCLQDFRDALKDQCEVFFVDVKCVGNDDDGFKAFERKLASSATKLKGESLIRQAKAANVKSTEVSERLKGIVTTRKEENKASLEKKLASIEKDRVAFDEICENLKSTEEIENIFSGDAKKEMRREFEEAIMSGKSEREALEQFLEKVNKTIKDTMTRKREDIKNSFRKWTGSVLKKEEDEKYPQLTKLENYQYRWYFDPNYYYTNNSIVAIAIVLGTAAAGFAGFGWIASGSLPFAFGGATMGTFGGIGIDIMTKFGCGDYIKKRFPISYYKISC